MAAVAFICLIVERGPVSKPLQQLDDELEEHDTSLALEIAEDTYAALLNNRPREEKMDERGYR